MLTLILIPTLTLTLILNLWQDEFDAMDANGDGHVDRAEWEAAQAAKAEAEANQPYVRSYSALTQHVHFNMLHACALLCLSAHRLGCARQPSSQS